MYGAPFQWRLLIFTRKNLRGWILEANKNHVSLKSYSLKIRIDSVNEILTNKEKVKWTCNSNTLTRITDWKIPCAYLCSANNIKSEDQTCITLCHTDDRKYFSDLSLTWNPREACTIHLVREAGEIWRCSCWEKR